MSRSFLLCAFLLACSGDKDDEDDDGSGEETGSPDTAADTAADTGFPEDPSPFTLQVTGALEQAITFDQPTCNHPTGSQNMRIFWRGTGHVFVLKVEVLGQYTGPGTYTSAEHDARASLQEEAGGTGTYFATAEGDEVELVVEGHSEEEGQLWGSWTVSGMSDVDGRQIALSPLPIPAWCSSFN